MNRVSAYNDTELVFDLCGSDVDFSNMRVCAVKSDLSSCRVETFCIHSDSDFDDFGTLDMSASLEDIRHLYSDSTDWTTPCNTVDVTSTWLGGYDIVQSSSICLRDDRPWRPKPISSSCHSESPTCFDGSHLTRQPCHVRALSFQDGNQVTEILVDSGSDATVVPLAFADCGRALDGVSNLVDCQGNRLSTSELREFSSVLQSSCGRTIRFKEVGHVSATITCPIISYGRLFRRGWRIGGNNDTPVLEHPQSNVAINMALKNESFVLQGSIRRLQQVSAIRVEIPQRWTQLTKGWYSTGNDLFLCKSTGECFIDPTEQYSIAEFPFRTTLALRADGWEVVESCKRLIHVDDKRAHLGAQCALTIISREWFDLEDHGVTRVPTQPDRSAVGPGRSSTSRPSRPQKPPQRALDLSNPSSHHAMPAGVETDSNMQVDDSRDDTHSQQGVLFETPNQQPNAHRFWRLIYHHKQMMLVQVMLPNQVKLSFHLQVLKKLHWLLTGLALQ